MGAMDISRTAESSGGLLMFNLFAQYCGQTMSDVSAVLVCTSLLASYLAIHNAATRYIFALAREKLLPRKLGEFHPARYAPSNASLAVSVITLVCVIAFAASGLDPYQAGVPVLIGVGTLGSSSCRPLPASPLLPISSARKGVASPWVIAASVVGAIGLCIASVVVSLNFTLLATIDIPIVAWLPAIYPVIVAAGVGFAFWLRALSSQDL